MRDRLAVHALFIDPPFVKLFSRLGIFNSPRFRTYACRILNSHITIDMLCDKLYLFPYCYESMERPDLSTLEKKYVHPHREFSP